MDSTQEEAKRLIKANKASNDQVITCITQTAGKGRQGREWISDEGNLFFSLLADSKNFILPQHSAIITPLVISNALQAIPTQIKWPNDIIIEGKKLCGILIEKISNYIIIGVGVNNNSRPEFLDKERKATCLAEYVSIDNNNLLKDILSAYKAIMVEYKTSGLENLRTEYLKRLYKYNQNIELDYLGKKVSGTIIDVNNEGELILETLSGTEIFKTGEIFEL